MKLQKLAASRAQKEHTKGNNTTQCLDKSRRCITDIFHSKNKHFWCKNKVLE